MIDSEVYTIHRKPKFFWQPRRETLLIVAYYDQPDEQATAQEAAQRRARHVAGYSKLPIETKICQRREWNVA